MNGYIKLTPTGDGYRIWYSDPTDRPHIRRRLRTLHKRLMHPVVVALSDPDCPLCDEYRKIGLEYYLLRLREHDLTVKFDLPLAEVDRILAVVRGFAKGWHHAA